MANQGAYVLKWRLEVCLLAAGAGPMEVPAQQTLIMNNDFGGNGGFVAVPGGASPTQANFNTAITTAASNMETAVANNLAQIQGFASGGG